MDKPHKRLLVWQKSVELAKDMYIITEKFPQTEKFGLVSQMRRAAISIASNIAEGSARQTNKEKLQFYYIARGSISELDTQLEISFQIGLINIDIKNKIFQLLDDVSRLLNGLIENRKKNEKI